MKAIIVCTIFAFSLAQENNVCKSYLDYMTKSTNPKCWHNPDVKSHPEDIFRRRNFPFESYDLTTEDGYIITLYRIPHNGTETDKKRTPVFLQHGITVTSAVFYSIGDRSLAFYLANQGFDVWIGNTRGTAYSSGHTKYTMDDPEYWLYSFHELGVYDLSTSLNFVREKTNTSGKIIYIGHSMGTTASYVYSIVKHEEASENLAGLISLAPVAFMKNLKNPQVLIAPFWKSIQDIANLFGKFGFFADLNQTREGNEMCMNFPVMPLCITSIFIGMGFDYEQIMPEDFPVMASYIPGGASLKCFAHFAQEVANKGTFQYYDYGETKNMELYGSKSPPPYDVTKISIPVHLLYGSNDFMADEVDVLTLFDVLETTKSVTHIPLDRKITAFNHGDFIYAKDIIKYLYPTLMEKVYSLMK